MKRGLALSLWLITALAAPLPELYDRLEDRLNQVRIQNPVASLAALDAAQSLLRQEGESLPTVLRNAVATSLQEARRALARGSAVDLEGHLLVARHLLGRALHEAFLQAQGTERQALLNRLARATGLPGTTASQVVNLPPEEARVGLEAHYLQSIAVDLQRALSAPSRQEAYLALARAYARYLLIQDSPRNRLQAQEFIQPLATLSQGGDYRTKTRALLEGVQSWRGALPVTQARTSPAKPEPPPTPSPPAAGKPTATPAPEEASPPSSFVPPSWASPSQGREMAQLAQALGFSSTLDILAVVTELQGQLALASAELSRQDLLAARERVGNVRSVYETRLYPLFRLSSPATAEAYGRALRSLEEAPALRTLDFYTLISGLEFLKKAFLNRPGEDPILWFVLFLLGLVGIPRAVFFLLAAVLTFFPLYLIRLTFGGRNVYWNLLGLAYLLLFLPILVEGLTYAASLLAEYGGLPGLALLKNLSIAQSFLAYLGWGVSVFGVVVLSAIGLRGIATQFGLLKERDKEAPPTAESRAPTSETVAEWDEEF